MRADNVVDDMVLASITRGDEAAFSAAVSTLSPRLLGLAVCWGAPRPEAHEVVRATWLRAFDGLAQFRSAAR